ncbi:S1C family serine protease [Kytococcus sedentarius]|uniref:S1C family serine protease n=1 Tax=Kytococcus sedentarius TaxID=1276 RepID=UPI0035BC1A5C
MTQHGQHEPYGPGEQYPPYSSMQRHEEPRGRSRGWWQVPAAAVLSAALATAGTWTLAENGIIGSQDSTPAAERQVNEGEPAAERTQGGGSQDGGDSAEGQKATPAATADGVDWSGVAEQVSPSVVAISVASGNSGGSGSGVILDDQGHVVTNDHVVSGATDIRVTLGDNRAYDAKVVGTDPETDLAVLEIPEAPDDLQPITVGDDKALSVGDPVMAVGNPLGLSGTVTTGIVSALDRPVRAGDAETQVVTNAVQTSAAINPGNSGGALVNTAGELVGINSSIATLGGNGQETGNIGIGFAITATQMKNVTSELIETGKATHAQLGVRVTDATVKVDGAHVNGAGISSVEPNTAAAEAGLEEGDVVVAIDGESVDSMWALIAQMHERAVGDTATVTVVRDGERQDLEVTAGAKE